jgi:hypothetical protein
MTTNQTRSGIARPIDEESNGLLRLVLKLDAVATGAVGLLSLAAGPALDGPLGIPISLLMPVGLFLIVYAAVIWVVATRRRLSRPAAWTAVAINMVYAVDALLVLVSGWFTLTVLGTAFVLFQAAAVALFAAAQFYALRRSV